MSNSNSKPQDRSPVKTITALQARQGFGQMLEHVYYRDEQYIIERAGRPMAAVVPVWQLEQWQKLQGQVKKSPETSKGRKRRRTQGEV
jgi:prevent-host-death family protein